MSQTFEAVSWRDGAVVMLDQRLLPEQEIYNQYDTVEGVAEAISTMVIRGAPAIGCAAALGVALAAHHAAAGGRQAVARAVDGAVKTLGATRPTAVNLFWALKRMEQVLQVHASPDGTVLAQALLEEGLKVIREDVAANELMGHHGAELLPPKAAVLTHCNAGALATGGYGTALGVIRAAVDSGKEICVYADETRPLLQGARLTAWELQRDGIEVTVIPDGAAARLMRQGLIDAAIVGADRIAANGDVANRSEPTASRSCRQHGIPFTWRLPCPPLTWTLPRATTFPSSNGHPKR